MNLNIDDYTHDLENLRKLHTDLEKQMVNFDEIVPFERQRTAQIYSPRLLNMMLVCGTHIESITKLIARRYDIVYNDLRSTIRTINTKSVLSNFIIVSIPHGLQFTPFTNELEWWESYNELKHELQEKQFKITYTRVMDAFAALSALHYFAGKINELPNKLERLFDMQNWSSDNVLVNILDNPRNVYPHQLWYSLLFKIKTVYLRDDL